MSLLESGELRYAKAIIIIIIINNNNNNSNNNNKACNCMQFSDAFFFAHSDSHHCASVEADGKLGNESLRNFYIIIVTDVVISPHDCLKFKLLKVMLYKYFLLLLLPFFFFSHCGQSTVSWLIYSAS